MTPCRIFMAGGSGTTRFIHPKDVDSFSTALYAEGAATPRAVLEAANRLWPQVADRFAGLA